MSNDIERPQTPNFHEAKSGKEAIGLLIEWKRAVNNLVPKEQTSLMHIWRKKWEELKSSQWYEEYLNAVQSGKIRKFKLPWFRSKWKDDGELDEQIKAWTTKVQEALDRKNNCLPPGLLPTPVGPAFKTNDDQIVSTFEDFQQR